MRTLYSRRARARRRGAAFVESVLVAGLFVLFFALMWTALGFFRTKLDVMADARQEAWQKALDPCGGSGIFGQVKQQALSDVENAEGLSEPSTQPGVEEEAEEDSGYVTIHRKEPFVSSKLAGGQAYELSGKMHVRCNEDIQSDSLWELTKSALGLAKDKVFK